VQSETRLRRYQDLKVWQRSIELACSVHSLAKRLSQLKEWDLQRQIETACRSVPANIAEGYGVGTVGAYRRHLRIARGSLYELETYLELIRRQQLVPDDRVGQVQLLLVEVSRLLAGLLRRLPPAS
jgi:four helix bundle protein